jgi:hypothetical protein
MKYLVLVGIMVFFLSLSACSATMTMVPGYSKKTEISLPMSSDIFQGDANEFKGSWKGFVVGRGGPYSGMTLNAWLVIERDQPMAGFIEIIRPDGTAAKHFIKDGYSEEGGKRIVFEDGKLKIDRRNEKELHGTVEWTGAQNWEVILQKQ